MIRFALMVLLLVALPGRADAGPLVGFVQGIISFISTGAVVAPGIGGAFAFGSRIAAFFAGRLGSVLLSLGSNALVAALSRPRMPPPQEQMVNLSQPRSPMQRVYGRVRKGGPIIFTGFRNFVRFYAVAIAAHRTKGVVQHWLDTSVVATDGTALGLVTTAPFVTYGAIRPYRGLPGQVVDARLDAVFAEIGPAHDFAGISYAVLEAGKPPAESFQAVYTTGREWTYAPVWDGHDEIWDPRDSTYRWTDNAALIIAHEAMFHGKEVDWALVAIEADVCDQLVTNGMGGLQKRWTINCVFDDLTGWEAARQQLAMACDAFFYETLDGKVGFFVGRWTLPTITLTDRDFLSLTVADKAWGPDIPGEAVVSYAEPNFDWQEAVCGAIVAEAGLPRIEEEVWAIDSHNQACRVAKRLIRRARARWSVRGQVKLIGYELIGQRFVRVQSDMFGLDLFVEIDRLARDSGGISFTLEGRSVIAEDMDFAALTEEPARPLRSEVVSDDAVPAVTGLVGAVVVGTGGIAQIEFTWPAQNASLTQQLRLRSLDGGPVEWQELSMGTGQLSYLASGLIDGATYDAQIRNRTTGGRVSVWSATVSVVAVANTTPPGALTGFAVTVSGGTTGAVVFTAPNSANYAACRIFRGTTNVFSSSVVVRIEYGVPGAADGWNDTGLAPGTYYYWAEAINGSGIAGARSGPASITII